jgi:hypothetical protein
LNLLPPPALPFLPPPIYGIVSTGIIIAFACMCTHPLSSPPLPSLPSSHWCQPSTLGRTCSALLFSDFAEEEREKIKKKNMTFLFI